MQREAIERGKGLEREVMAALGALDGVTIHRNPVARVQLPSGGWGWTGIGGEGAPDLLAEVLTWGGTYACVWLECKSGDFARLNPAQRRWHEAAERTGRHVYVVRSVEHALEIVRRIRHER